MSEEQSGYTPPRRHDKDRPPISRADVERVFAEPLFSISEVEKLLIDCGRDTHPNGYTLEKAHYELWQICAHFAFERRLEVLPALSEQDRKIHEIVHASAILLRAAGFDDLNVEPAPETLLPCLGHGALFGAAASRQRGAGDEWEGISGEAETVGQFRAVWKLRQDALAARKHMALQKSMVEGVDGGVKKGRRKEQAIERLAARLSEYYWYVWLEEPTVALDIHGREPTSPFLRLFVNVQHALHARGLDTKKRSADSLRKRWEALDDFERIKFKSTGSVGADSFLPAGGEKP